MAKRVKGQNLAYDRGVDETEEIIEAEEILEVLVMAGGESLEGQDDDDDVIDGVHELGDCSTRT